MRKPGEEQTDAERAKKEQEEREKAARKKPEGGDGNGTPLPGPDGSPSDSAMPAWIANLPPEIRRAVSTGDLDTVPPAYRELLRRYQRFLLERPPEAK